MKNRLLIIFLSSLVIMHYTSEMNAGSSDSLLATAKDKFFSSYNELKKISFKDHNWYKVFFGAALVGVGAYSLSQGGTLLIPFNYQNSFIPKHPKESFLKNAPAVGCLFGGSYIVYSGINEKKKHK